MDGNATEKLSISAKSKDNLLFRSWIIIIGIMFGLFNLLC